MFGRRAGVGRLIRGNRDADRHGGVRYTWTMIRLMDAAYMLGAAAASPVWLPRMLRAGKHRTDWAARFGRVAALPPRRPGRRRVLVHGVSVGEVNAARLLVGQVAALPSRPEVVVSATTDTGIARAQALYGGEHPVVRFPFDLSWAVGRLLDAVRPDAVVLLELEVWPTFVATCAARGVPVGIVNGRLTARSHRRYRLVRPIIRAAMARLALAAVQTEAYAARFRDLGAPVSRVQVTGTMKWDTAEIVDHVPGAEALAEAMGIDRGRPLVVAGSTAPDEHALLRDAMPQGVQLLCAPRKPEWFDAAAADLSGCARRSRGQRGSETGRFLLDSIGELRAAYALADVVVVGRSFGSLHGSDMMEPVALGKAVVVGPRVTDFQDVVEALLSGEGIVQAGRSELAAVVRRLLSDEPERWRLAAAGRAVIRSRQGATATHVALIDSLLSRLPAA
jgi:3-deoxy-D-manno-octulosonic-acid transferase